MLLKEKKIINLISVKYGHLISYEKDDILINNKKNNIRISKTNENELIFFYNTSEGIESINLESKFIFDLLIKVFNRENLEKIVLSRHLITTDLFFEEEQNKEFWIQIFDKAKRKWLNDGTIEGNIGGNRILVEYFNGILIFTDDLNFFASNAIEY